ncbi:MAG: carboxypeptidase-like regulatory domain-containing protein [Pyrinomonadaceae bacterium]
MRNENIKRLAFVSAFVAIVLSFSGIVWGQQFQGAIYTSAGDGSVVNQNIYSNKSDVYLNGGPQNQNGPGLPDGTYYFQVTTPSGDLLSTDNAVCRQIKVVGGVISGADTLAAGLCAHPNGLFNPNNGSTPVQLMPFSDTTNAGGEYKVWLIRQATSTTISTLDPRVINFTNNNSKTDNFKVAAPTPTPDPCNVPNPPPDCNPDQGVVLSGHKFYDANANAVDNNEAPVAGITIVINWIDTAGSHTGTATTGIDGNWTFGPIPTGSTYTVYELVPCVDDNADLVCDAGHYWVQTAPVPDSQNFQGYNGTANTNVTGLNFGDICFGPASGGYTLGYWSNKNGEKVMTNGGPNGVDQTVYPATVGTGMNGDLLFLRNLNLKGSTGSNFDPTGYTQFRTWLLNGNAVNMSYMLSVQLSATSLDVRHKFLYDAQIVDARTVCNSAGTCLGFNSIGSIRQGADTSLNNFSYTISGDPHRQSQELLKNFLDSVNNNRLPFASVQPCAVFYPPPPPPPTPTPTPTP